MEFIMIPADPCHELACEAALQESTLGDVYFSTPGKALAAVREGIAKKQMQVAVSADGGCLGFVWVIPEGSFHAFPYLHLIAVRQEFRGRGIGAGMLAKIEDSLREMHSRLFLLVADFNADAKRLYVRLGYEEIGKLPDLYRNGVTEQLMMKRLSPER